MTTRVRDAGVLHPDFIAEPYWWSAYRPRDDAAPEVPARTSVAIVGAGYAGLSAALELSRHGIEATVLEAQQLGYGASTRNGGGVSGGINLGRRLSGKHGAPDPARQRQILADSNEGYDLVERLIREESINCGWQTTGRFIGAWTPRHFARQQERVRTLNEFGVDCHMVPRERQRDEIASDFYFGGMVIERTAALHPALYYKGLLDACVRRGVAVCAHAPVTRIERQGAGWRITTGRRTLTAENIVIATNGYTGDVTPDLKRRIVPIASHIIATEELPADLAASLVPKRRTLADTRRVVCYYRMSPDGKRMIFGGRPRFTQVDSRTSAPLLHRFMTDRFPQLAEYRVTHAWTGNVAFTFDGMPHMGQRDGLYYCLGCNGSGVAMMTNLGYQTARRIAGVAGYRCSFDSPEFPGRPFYNGSPWILPAIGGWYRFLDAFDREVARLKS